MKTNYVGRHKNILYTIGRFYEYAGKDGSKNDISTKEFVYAATMLNRDVFPKPDFDVFISPEKRVKGGQYTEVVELSHYPTIAPNRRISNILGLDTDPLFNKTFRLQLGLLLRNDHSALNIDSTLDIDGIGFLVFALISAYVDKKQTVVSFQRMPRILKNKHAVILKTLNEFVNDNHDTLASIAMVYSNRV